MTISPSKRYLAWSEDCDTGIIVVYDLSKIDKLEKEKNDKKRIIATQDCKSRNYVALDFNKLNEKRIAALVKYLYE